MTHTILSIVVPIVWYKAINLGRQYARRGRYWFIFGQWRALPKTFHFGGK